MSGHEDFEGLAAGYALHALEPEDEQRLAAHLLTCTSCARLVADTAAVGAAFALSIEAEQPRPELRERVLAAAAAEPRTAAAPSEALPPLVAERTEPVATTTQVVVARSAARRHRWGMRVAVGVLAAAVGAAIAVPVTLAVSESSPPAGRSALEQWLLAPHARELTLTGPDRATRGKAVLSERGIYLLANGLPRNDRQRSTYVLWALNGSGVPKAVTTFDVSAPSPLALTTGTLPYAESQISAVAVSYEPGRTAPAKPTDVVLAST